MKPEQIVVGATYFDGKAGLRRVIGEGQQYALYSGQHNTDAVGYENLGPRQADHNRATRQSMAQWARIEVPADQVDALADVLAARALMPRLKETDWRLLHDLEDRQAGKPHAQSVTPAQGRVAQRLADQKLVILASPTMARLAPHGERVLHGAREGGIPLPDGVSLAASLTPEERALLQRIFDHRSLQLQATPVPDRNRLEDLHRMGAIWWHTDGHHKDIHAQLTHDGVRWVNEASLLPPAATPTPRPSRPRLR